MVSSTALGQYLRARRELVRPEDVNLPKVGRRRVPGLRREELAMLAGISSDYYLRLEQGRDHHPSARVIDALARALQLDEDATALLHSLSQPAAARLRTEEPERAPDSVIQLIASWSNTPAFVQGRHMDVLAANALASAVSPVFSPGVRRRDPVILTLAVAGMDHLALRPAEAFVLGSARAIRPQIRRAPFTLLLPV
jgi:transcriptional regulator with XRE-family HTH domain